MKVRHPTQYNKVKTLKLKASSRIFSFAILSCWPVPIFFHKSISVIYIAQWKTEVRNRTSWVRMKLALSRAPGFSQLSETTDPFLFQHKKNKTTGPFFYFTLGKEKESPSFILTVYTPYLRTVFCQHGGG